VLTLPVDAPPPHPITRALNAAQAGDGRAAAELLPLVYAELRDLARGLLSRLPAGQTLQPTALVHEAYLRVAGGADPGWDGRRHFFGSAARAMRQILVDQARRKAALKRGGGGRRSDIDPDDLAIQPPDVDVIALDEALDRLEAEDPRKAQIVMLRYFAGLTIPETAETLGVSTATVEREWRYSRVWLFREIEGREAPPEDA
jgi:RNA polymerase sigma factor (TIGR02999 family)